jgi:hypothetical protein
MQRESCFLAGATVRLGTGDKQMIQALGIGQRLSTPESQTRGADFETRRLGEAKPGSHLAPRDEPGSPPSPLSGAETEVDPATWRSYTVRLRDARAGWDILTSRCCVRRAGWLSTAARWLVGVRCGWTLSGNGVMVQKNDRII